MSAEIPIWVEVETTVKIWRKTYGVTAGDAYRNVEYHEGERLTGEVRYDPPEEEEADET